MWHFWVCMAPKAFDTTTVRSPPGSPLCSTVLTAMSGLACHDPFPGTASRHGTSVVQPMCPCAICIPVPDLQGWE